MYLALRNFAIENGKVNKGEFLNISSGRAKDLVEAGFIEKYEGDEQATKEYFTEEERAEIEKLLVKEEKGEVETKEEKAGKKSK